jgi:hypothetical protein
MINGEKEVDIPVTANQKATNKAPNKGIRFS